MGWVLNGYGVKIYNFYVLTLGSKWKDGVGSKWNGLNSS